MPYALLIPLGSLLLAVGLARGYVLPRWQAALIGGGAVQRGLADQGTLQVLLDLPFLPGALAAAFTLIARDRLLPTR